MPEIDFFAISVMFAALALGGVLKGATGAGVPVIAIPVMATFFDVRLAVAVLALPNLATNIFQAWQYWPDRMKHGFTWKYAVAGGLGAILGTVLLAITPVEILTLIIAGSVIVYVVLRLAKPDFKLTAEQGLRFVLPTGFAAGVMQGAAGISAPISLSFLNALRPERSAFIATISTFFLALSLCQAPALAVAGIMTLKLAVMSLLAVIPLFAFMPVGAWLARRMDAVAFDRLILVLLIGLALRMIWTALV